MRRWFKYSSRGIIFPSAATFIDTVIPEIYEETRRGTAKELSDTAYVALTTDGWTSTATERFLTVTAHHITLEWEMRRSEDPPSLWENKWASLWSSDTSSGRMETGDGQQQHSPCYYRTWRVLENNCFSDNVNGGLLQATRLVLMNGISGVLIKKNNKEKSPTCILCIPRCNSDYKTIDFWWSYILKEHVYFRRKYNSMSSNLCYNF